MTKIDLRQIEDLFEKKLEQKLNEKLDQKLRAFATKDDLRAFATKDDLKMFVMKQDLVKISLEIKGLKQEMKKIKEILEMVIASFDQDVTEGRRRVHHIENHLTNIPTFSPATT